MNALLSGKYDLSRTAVIMSQTGGGCRASNYIGFIRRALIKAGIPDVPVISLSAQGLESNPGFSYDIPMLKKMCIRDSTKGQPPIQAVALNISLC